MAERTAIVFPNAVGAISGVSMVEVGVRHIWVHRHDGRKGVRLPRKAFTDDELMSGNILSFRARELMDASLRLPGLPPIAPAA